MTDVNKDYFVLQCGSIEVPSPYCSCSKSHYLIYQEPVSLKYKIQGESPIDFDENIPLINAMVIDGTPFVSKKIKMVLECFDIYKLQLQPMNYIHANNKSYEYWVIMLDNIINAYDFDNAEYHRRKSGDKVSAINIRLNSKKLLEISLEKRLIFDVPGMRGTHVVHKTIAEPLITLKAQGLNLVPLLEWRIGYGMTI